MITTSRREKTYLRDRVEALGAKRLVEVGAFKGQTTAVLSASAPDGQVAAIDPMRWASRPASPGEWIDTLLHPFSYERAFWRNVRRSGHDNVRLFKHLSHDPALLAKDDPALRELDFLFIDGEHLYESVKQDFENWGARVRRGGLVLLHDCCARFEGVERAVDEIASDPGFRVGWPTRASGTIASIEVL